MRLGLALRAVDQGADWAAEALTLTRAAEELGFDVVWAAEAFGFDAVSVLGWLAARTERIGLGSGVLQIPGRTPAMTAMTAAGLDAVSGGRFRLGLGVSGPQVSHGWHGVPFDQPLQRTAAYLRTVRRVLAREPISLDDATRPIRLAARPKPERIPIYLAAIGPRNLELAGRLADGVLGAFFSPEHAELQLGPLRAGRQQAAADRAERANGGGSGEERAAGGGVPGDRGGGPGAGPGAGLAAGALDGFDVAVTVPVALDLPGGTAAGAARDQVRPYLALYLGGMGSREHNFYARHAVRMGFAAEATRIQDLYLSGRPRDAAATVPRGLIESTSLVGSVAALPARLEAYAAAGVTTVNVIPFAPTVEERVSTLRCLADARDAAGLAS